MPALGSTVIDQNQRRSAGTGSIVRAMLNLASSSNLSPSHRSTRRAVSLDGGAVGHMLGADSGGEVGERNRDRGVLKITCKLLILHVRFDPL